MGSIALVNFREEVGKITFGNGIHQGTCSHMHSEGLLENLSCFWNSGQQEWLYNEIIHILYTEEQEFRLNLAKIK